MTLHFLKYKRMHGSGTYIIFLHATLNGESNESSLFGQMNRVSNVNEWYVKVQIDINEVFCCHLLYALENLNDVYNKHWRYYEV